MISCRVRPLYLLPCILLICACGSTPPQAAKQPEPKRELIRTEPVQAPDWKDTPPQNGTEIYFVGLSRAYDTAADARSAARDDAFSQIVKYYGQYIQSKSIEKSNLAGNSGDILTPYIEKEEEITRFAEAVVSQVGADKYYTEVYINAQNREEYIVYVLCQISRQKAEQDIDEFEQKISERYSNLISAPRTLIGALKVYEDIYTSLQQNPLHQMTASYNSPQGKVSLFDYCRVQMNTLSGTVSFANIPGQKVPKGGTINVNVRLSSSVIPDIGNAPCRVSIRDRNNSVVAESPYTVGQNNSFFLEIKTARLEAGNYNILMELPLNEGAPITLRNPSSGFSLEVEPLNTVHIIVENPAAEPLKNRVAQIMQQQGLLLVDVNAAYLVRINVELSESQTANTFRIQPTVHITMEQESDGKPLVTFSKQYQALPHITREEALQRSYRNIEQDLGGNFTREVGAIER